MLKRKGIFAILTLVGLFIILHLGFPPEQHAARTTGTTMLGGIAFLLMTVSMFLSTRVSAVEGCFGGLDRMYQVHKFCGVFALLFVLVHFFGVPKELPAGVDLLTNPLTPSAPFGMVALILLVLMLVITLNRKIPYSKWRPVHKFMGLVYVLIIAHFMSAPAIFFEKFSASGVMLMIAAVVGVLSFIYSVFGMNKRTATEYKIIAVNTMERATEIVLKPIAGAMKHKPGQFAFVEIQGKGWSEPHPFTISSAPDDANMRFTIKVLGDWSRKVREELKVGGEVKLRGPYGSFNTEKAGNKQIWLAGGVGLTPFLSMIRAMQAGDPRQIHLVYAARNETDAIFLPELKERAKELGNVTIVPLFSDQKHFANVEAMKTRLPDALDTYEYFMCGPKPMTSAIMKDLKKAGVPRAKIHTEAFEFR